MGTQAQFERDHVGAAQLTVVGEIDLGVADEFRRALIGAVEAATTAASVDLTGVTFFNSTGIAVLLEGRRAAGKRGVRLVIEPGSAVRRVLELVGLGEHLDLPARAGTAKWLLSPPAAAPLHPSPRDRA
jgi:anti-sigma B factor antagonist